MDFLAENVYQYIADKYVYLKTKILHGPILCFGLWKALQQISKTYIVNSSSSHFPLLSKN